MSTDVRDARGLPEEGFHEIQLSGKQLVFLFMATTVVSVVIFLCGVLVGRGVRSSLGDTATVAAASEAAPESPASEPAPAETPPAAEQPSTYHESLTAEKPPAEKIEAKAEPPAPQPEPEPEPAAVPPAAAATAPAVSSPAAAAAEQPWFVQVTALKKKAEADGIASRLKTRGYTAYVVAPGGGATALFRVRVGPFGDKADAEKAVKRLTSEEQFKPWISR